MTEAVAAVRFKLNGSDRLATFLPKATLLSYLRDEAGMMSVKDGCSQGQCGTCMVLINGKPELACIFRMDRLEGAEIETVENLPDNGKLHPIQEAFIASGAIQCGFCTPGMLMATKGLLANNADPNPADIRAALDKNLCRCGSYPKAIKAVTNAAAILRGDMEGTTTDWKTLSKVVGQSVPKLEAPLKATGRFPFADDFAEIGMAFGKILWSDHPHAIITAIHTKEAEALEGVVAVLTAKDLPGRNLYGTIQPDQPVLCDQKVRFVGDVVALVIAETEEQAEAARDLIQVDYQTLPGVYSPDEALAQGAPSLHEQGNIHARLEVNKGDVQAGFEDADLVLEDTFTTPFIEHAFLEPESGLATIDAQGVITIRMASQYVKAHRDMVAQSLGLPKEQVNLIHVQPGGAFGAKNDISLHILLGLAALKTKRPIKMTLTRFESLRSHPKRHAMQVRMKIGAKQDGTLTALEAEIISDTGAYASEGVVVLGQAAVFAGGPYVIPNVSVLATSVYTNNVPAGAMRGFGIPQVAFATEMMIDALARKLMIDPFEFRMHNALEPGTQTTAGQELRTSVALKETIRLARKEAQNAPPPREGWKRGLGVACSYKNVGVGLGLNLDSGSASVALTARGKLRVKVGGVDLGQGSDTTLAQIAAQATGIPFGRVMVDPVDAFESPDGGVTSASRTTYISGNAIVQASAKLRTEMIAFAATQLGIGPEKVTFEEGTFSDGKGSKITVIDLAGRAAAAGIELSASQHYVPPATYEIWHHGPPDPDAPTGSDFFFSYSYATQVAIVDVDERLGQVKLVKIVAAHDVGRAINPLGVEAQIEGSCLMGMGYALSEEFKLDQGRVLTDNLRKCHIVSFNNCPDIVPIIVEEDEPTGPFGAKGIAEAAAVPTAPAIINAIRDATGITIRDLPATPIKILDALHDMLEEEA